MPPIFLRKYARSSDFAKPASCEVLRSRTSTTLFTPDLSKRSKNPSAVVLVKPMVETVVLDNRITPQQSDRLSRSPIAQMQLCGRVPDRPSPVFLHARRRDPRYCDLRAQEASPRSRHGLPARRRSGCGPREYRDRAAPAPPEDICDSQADPARST